MNDNDIFLCRLGREGKGILTFKKQLSIVDQLLSGIKLGAEGEKTCIRSPRAISIMNHSSDYVRIFRKVVKAHFAII